MNKAIVTLTAALLLTGFAGAQQVAVTSSPAPMMTDVPASHWAKDAIDRLNARGIILGYPDGTFRGTQNITRYEAALMIARVLDQLGSGTVPVSSLNSDDLRALSNAVNELSADLAAMGVRVSDLESGKASVADVEALAARIDNLSRASGTDVDASRDQLMDDLQAVHERFATVEARVQTLEQDLESAQDLNVILNQDVLDMQDRLSMLEETSFTRAEGAALQGQVSDLTTRVGQYDDRIADLENGRVRLGLGNFGVSYVNRTVSGTSFDVDRLTQGSFADSRHGDGDVRTVEQAQTSGDPDFGVITLGVTGLTSKESRVQIDRASLNLGVNPNVLVDTSRYNTAGNVDRMGNTVPALVFSGAQVTGHVGDSKFGANYAYRGQAVKFNDYLYDNDMNPATAGATPATADGVANAVVVSVDGNGLPMNPAITAVLGSDSRSTSVLGNTAAVRAEVKPRGEDTSFGVSYARWRGYQGAGVDARWQLGPVDVKGVYAFSVADGLSFAERQQAGDIRALYGKAGDFLQAGGYMQAVSAGWNAAASGSNDADKYRAIDVNRYGMAARVSMPTQVGLALGGYYDSEARYDGTQRGNSFGVNAGVALRSNLRLVGFYNSSTATRSYNDDGVVQLAHEIDAETTVGGVSPVIGISAPYSRGNNYGVALTHSGTGGTPLVAGLDLGLGYAHFTKINTNDLSAYARYDGQLGPVELTPFARYRNYQTGQTGYLGFNNVKAGMQLKTSEGLLPLGAQLSGDYVTRRTSYSDGGNQTAEQMWRVGAAFNNILGSDTSFGVGYANYSGSGLNNARVGVFNNVAFDPTQDAVYGSAVGGNAQAYRMTAGGVDRTNTAALNGIYTQLNYRGLLLDYGRFKNVSNAQAADTVNSFRASYTFKF